MAICKKCLLMEASRDLDDVIYKAIEDIRIEDRANDDLIENRIGICETCDRLSDRTCLACGCFVEIRATLSSGKCPKHKW